MSKSMLGWLQLKSEKVRFAVAVFGVAFAVILILMQIGFRESMFESGLRLHRGWIYDIVILSPETRTIILPRTITSRRLYQALSLPQVESVSPVYLERSLWKDLNSGRSRELFMVGFDPEDQVFRIEAIRNQIDVLKTENGALFDSSARPEFGPVAEIVARDGAHEVVINDLIVEVRGTFPMGSSFGIDGTMVVGTEAFLRLFPVRARGLISVGLVNLRAGEDPDAVAARLREYLPRDVSIYTRQEFVDKEVAYWNAETPIGYIFGFGIIVGLVVGSIIVYQILFADVSDHLPEYATLKAIGYSNFYLAKVVMQQGLILASVGFLPGLVITLFLYKVSSAALMIDIQMTVARALTVLGLTVAMCAISALLALRKLRAADPATIF